MTTMQTQTLVWCLVTLFIFKPTKIFYITKPTQDIRELIFQAFTHLLIASIPILSPYLVRCTMLYKKIKVNMVNPLNLLSHVALKTVI